MKERFLSGSNLQSYINTFFQKKEKVGKKNCQRLLEEKMSDIAIKRLKTKIKGKNFR